MNTMIDNPRRTTATAASGSPLAASRYRTGGTVLAHTGITFTGDVCLLNAVPSSLQSVWGGFMGGVSATATSRPTTVRLFSDYSKPRHGSLASDGSG